jgi:hypothetical protein
MNSNCLPTPSSDHREKEIKHPSSRLLDEKISDDDATETNTDSALRPAGLKNPFWR